VSPQSAAGSVERQPFRHHLSRGDRFVTTRLVLRGDRVSTPVSWSDSNVNPTNFGLGRATTVLSPPDLVHRGGRVAARASIVWVTVILPLPAATRRNRGGWGRKGLSMSTWDVLEGAARSVMIGSFAPGRRTEGWAVEGEIWHSMCSWHLCELQRFERDLKMI